MCYNAITPENNVIALEAYRFTKALTEGREWMIQEDIKKGIDPSKRKYIIDFILRPELMPQDSINK